MSEYSFNNDDESISFVLTNLGKNPNLNDWEVNFIADITEQYHDSGNLFEGQLVALSNIWEKY